MHASVLQCWLLVVLRITHLADLNEDDASVTVMALLVLIAHLNSFVSCCREGI